MSNFFECLAFLNEEKMIDVMSRSSVFLGGAKLKKFPYPDTNLPYITLGLGIDTFSNDYLKNVLQAMIQFRNITVYPDALNIINLVAVHVADGVYVKRGNQTVCFESKFYFIFILL